MKKDFRKFIDKGTHYFSEGHLEVWFTEKYLGQTKDDIHYMLSSEHDDSLEIENAENELERELKDKEKSFLSTYFIGSVIENIEFSNDIAVGYWDSLDKLNR